MKKKTRTVILVTAVAVAVIAASILMGLFIPVRGKADDSASSYWSRYDAFDPGAIETMEVTGDGFKILQLTDLHYHLPHMTAETDRIVETLVQETAPDLIVITGDSTYGPTNMMYARHIVKRMDGYKIPWAIVYGNHDEEGKADKNWLGNVYESAEYGVYRNGPSNIGGLGNYAVNLTVDGAPFYTLVMMDSNRSTRYEGKDEYGAFTPSEVDWYGWLSDGLKQNGYDKSMMFFHIPFPEYLTAYEEWEAAGFDPTRGSGEKREGVGASSYNPGMFAEIEQKGMTTHVFVGHDHVNNYTVDYRGVKLTYGMKSSRQFYSDDDMIGGTLITIDRDQNVTIERKYVPFS